MVKTAYFTYSPNHYPQRVTATICQHPFGMLMPGRTYASEAYSWGFNGKEKDDAISGSGNNLDFGARIYDCRLGRWLRVDPLFKNYPSYNPYCYAINSVILFYDLDGEVVIKSTSFKKKNKAAFEIFTYTEAAQDLLNKFANIGTGDYQSSTNGALSRHTLEFDTKSGVGPGLTRIYVKVDKEWKEYVPAKHNKILSEKPEFKFVVNVNGGVVKSDGGNAVTLNHEGFLWIKSYAEVLEKFERGNLTPEEFGKELELMSTYEWINKKYKDIFNNQSDLQKAHSSLLVELNKKLIADPKTDEDIESNKKINIIIEDVKANIKQEKSNHAENEE